MSTQTELYQCAYCPAAYDQESRLRSHVIKDHLRHPDTGVQLSTDLPPVPAPNDLHIVVARNDGSYEVWERPYTGLNPTIAGWQDASLHIERKRWKVAPVPAQIETRYVMVKANWSDASHYAACLAAEMAGISRWTRKLDRRKDGYFVCPHCGKRYQNVGSFRQHVAGNPRWGNCGDTGASYFVGLSNHRWRNFSSRAVWLSEKQSRAAA